MVNANYEGSVAQRFMKFKTALYDSPVGGDDLFDTVNLYIPSYLVAGNFINEASVTPANESDVKVVKIDAESAKNVLVQGGDLYTQLEPSFNDGASINLSYNLIVFHLNNDEVANFTATVVAGGKAISYAPLTNAFKLTYMSGYFKMLYSKLYNVNASDTVYFKLFLCLAQLVRDYSDLSALLGFVCMDFSKVAQGQDTNDCKILSKTAQEEVDAVKAAGFNTSNVGATPATTVYFWGLLNYMGAKNTWLSVHSSTKNLIFYSLKEYFRIPNSSKIYLGNKLEKVRLSGDGVKPTGVASILDSSINMNCPKYVSDVLDSKNVNYYISISSASGNDCVAVSSKCIMGAPVLAIAIGRYIDYMTSQQLAKIITDASTTTKPILKNESSYEMIQRKLLENIQKFTSIGRLVEVKLNFPAMSELPESKTDIVVVQGWEAKYVYDLEKVEVTGTVVV